MLLNTSNMSVHGCGVISDRDVEFGRVLQPVSVVCDGKPSERVSADRLTRLSEQQRDDLLSVLDEFAVCFSDRPGLYAGAVHRIETTAEFEPRRMRAYRASDVFTPYVRTQIGAHPTVRQSDSPSDRLCGHENGGLRLAVDYRYFFIQL